MIRVLIADDHAVVREGLRTYLSLQDGIEVVGEAADGLACVMTAEALKPDVVLMDLVMPRLDGIGAMRELRRLLPGTRVIVLTSYTDDERIMPAIQAGAAGYLLKTSQPSEVARAVRAAADGEAVLDPRAAARLVEAVTAPAASERLTPRERQVLVLIGRGYANKRIALELGLSEKTIKTHVSHVLSKLGVTDRTAAALHAVRAGLIET